MSKVLIVVVVLLAILSAIKTILLLFKKEWLLALAYGFLVVCASVAFTVVR